MTNTKIPGRSSGDAVAAGVERHRRDAADLPSSPGRTDRPALPAAIDVALPLPSRRPVGSTRLQEALDLAERPTANGQLLARPGLPEILAVRDWTCGQVLSQHAGAPPAALTGSDQHRVSARIATTQPHPPGRRLDAVRYAEGNIVAADDTNHIVAVSRPLAELLGWHAAELVGRRITTLVPARLRDQHVAGFTRHVTTGQAYLLGVPLALPVLCADGTGIGLWHSPVSAVRRQPDRLCPFGFERDGRLHRTLMS